MLLFFDLTLKPTNSSPREEQAMLVPEVFDPFDRRQSDSTKRTDKPDLPFTFLNQSIQSCVG
jgi:hypothetical protein